MKILLALLLLGVCWFGRVEWVSPRDRDPYTGAWLTWQVFFRHPEGRLLSAMTWWPDYAPGDIVRICPDTQFPWGEWHFNHVPLIVSQG